ncbi:MAG TPA: nucleotide-binding protein [Acidobacteriota bacterium]|nr:nucleotide-binding protein [Acidobacteriota bacterium]HNT18208.1 nucleotide-binding protein [Acidobacteriota bacterium]
MDKENSIGTNSLLPRFQGDSGGTILTEVLCNQILIRGEVSVCEEFKKSIELLELNNGDTLIKQDGADNKLYFILSGSFTIVVNGREIAIRVPGQHVGEMALIDPTSRRSASVIAREASVVASINEEQFSIVANNYPQVWRRIAVELSSRLKQRNRFIEPPRNQPVVFIGSSSESLDIAREIHNLFEHDSFVVDVWTSGIFMPSATSIESLVDALKRSDFGVIIFNPDDIIQSRDETTVGPRDNVVFELGLFIGHLGRERTFFVVPRGKDIKIPTDLLGVKPLEYAEGTTDTLKSRIGPLSNELRKLINEKGPR